MAARASIRRALEGAAAHRRLQAEQEEGYLKEVPLSVTLERPEYMLTVEGRADGIVPLAAQVHEIKTTYLPLEELDWEHYPAYHAQLWIYGFIYALDKGLSGVSLRLTYYQMQNGKTRDFITQASFEELCTRFNAMVEDYVRISDETVRHGQRRDVSLAELAISVFQVPAQPAGYGAAGIYGGKKQKNAVCTGAYGHRKNGGHAVPRA